MSDQNLNIIFDLCINSLFNILITGSIINLKGIIIAFFPLIRKILNYIVDKVIYKLNNPMEYSILIAEPILLDNIIKFFKYSNNIQLNKIGYSPNGNSYKFSIVEDMEVVYEKDNLKYIFRAKKSSSENFYINVFGKSMKILEDLIEYIEDFNEKYELKTMKNKYLIYNYNIIKKNFDKIDNILVDKNFENVYLPKDIYNKIIKNIDDFINMTSEYNKLGFSNKRSFLFYGKPGCGKTSTIYALCKKYGRPMYSINLNDIETDMDLCEAFSRIKPKSIVLLEDIDSSYIVLNEERKNKIDEKNNKKKDNSEKTQKFSQNTLLNYFDGTITLNDVILIATTNHIEYLDERFIRTGRMDYHIEFKYINIEQLEKIIKRFLNKEISSEVKSYIVDYKYSPSDIIFKIILPNFMIKDKEKSYNIIMDKLLDAYKNNII